MNTLLLTYSGHTDRPSYPVIARVADPDQACVTYKSYLGFYYECKTCRGYGTIPARNPTQLHYGSLDWYDDCPSCGISTQHKARVPPGVCLNINPLVMREVFGQHDRIAIGDLS